MDPFIQYGMAASIQAVKDAGLTTGAELRKRAERIGVIVGSGIGGLPTDRETAGRVHRARAAPDLAVLRPGLDHQHDLGPRLDPASASTGPNMAIVTACTTGLHCIGEAGRLIEVRRRRRDDRRRRRGTVSPLGVGGFAAARALSTRNDDPQTRLAPVRPRSRRLRAGRGRRRCWCSRSYEHAKRARRAASTPSWSATAWAPTPIHMTAPNVDGAERAMRAALRNAGRRPERRPVPQRARHLDAAGRPQRDQRDQARLRRPRAEAGRQLDQVDDRPPARRRRRHRVGVHRARAAPPGVAADDQHLTTRIPSATSTTAPTQAREMKIDVRGEEQLRLRRHQRHAGLPARLTARSCASAAVPVSAC